MTNKHRLNIISSLHGTSVTPPRRLAGLLAIVLATCTTTWAETFTVRVDPPGAFHQFVPQFLTIRPGDTVRWVWEGNFHTVTSGNPETGVADGIFGTPLRNFGAQYSFTFPNPGTFDYYCAPHREMGMTGRITVAGGEPTPPPAAQPLNISTRVGVQTGDNVLIGGFIITGMQPKKVIMRAIGPSLQQAGLTGVLADPVLELRGTGGVLILSNDNWQATQQAEIAASGVPPQHELESAIVATLAPGAYTGIVTGKSSTTGIGLVEVFDLDQASDSQLANISTRGFVGTGDNLMIGGFILGGGSANANILVRALGPSLTQAGITGAMSDPTLELRDSNGAIVRANNDWKETQQAAIAATGIPPQNDLEAALLATLPPGAYTALVRGTAGSTGVALVEIFQLL
ncbi:MAG: hypothetical protein H0V56_00640 [Chthoniobacterales bacterium]|nr:hypothetical protein [Chthoniobacterales bacterium]